MDSPPEDYSAQQSAPAAGRNQLPVAVLPNRDHAQELAWDFATAQQREIYGFDSLDPRSRAFNLIRGKLLELVATKQWRLFGAVSATPNVGKSFVTANVAAALSRDPRVETCVVDLDLRRGSLTDTFGINPDGGIWDYLEGGVASPSGYVLERERLLIMPTKAGRARSAELLAGDRAQALLRAMRASNQQTLYLVDLPPVFANDDASTVLGRLDAYILVVEEGRTTQREINDTVSLLGPTRLAGVVLNKYREGVMSEGYGIHSDYAAGYAVNETVNS